MGSHWTYFIIIIKEKRQIGLINYFQKRPIAAIKCYLIDCMTSKKESVINARVTFDIVVINNAEDNYYWMKFAQDSQRIVVFLL